MESIYPNLWILFRIICDSLNPCSNGIVYIQQYRAFTAFTDES